MPELHAEIYRHIVDIITEPDEESRVTAHITRQHELASLSLVSKVSSSSQVWLKGKTLILVILGYVQNSALQRLSRHRHQELFPDVDFANEEYPPTNGRDHTTRPFSRRSSAHVLQLALERRIRPLGHVGTRLDSHAHWDAGSCAMGTCI
jgi:hypothetical protein